MKRGVNAGESAEPKNPVHRVREAAGGQTHVTARVLRGPSPKKEKRKKKRKKRKGKN